MFLTSEQCGERAPYGRTPPTPHPNEFDGGRRPSVGGCAPSTLYRVIGDALLPVEPEQLDELSAPDAAAIRQAVAAVANAERLQTLAWEQGEPEWFDAACAMHAQAVEHAEDVCFSVLTDGMNRDDGREGEMEDQGFGYDAHAALAAIWATWVTDRDRFWDRDRPAREVLVSRLRHAVLRSVDCYGHDLTPAERREQRAAAEAQDPAALLDAAESAYFERLHLITRRRRSLEQAA